MTTIDSSPSASAGVGDQVVADSVLKWGAGGPAAALRGAFAAYPTGVVAVCGLREGAPVGVALGSFTSVSLEPALVSFCIGAGSSTWPLLKDLPALGISVLAEGQHELGRRMATTGLDRFAGVDWRATGAGAVFIGGAALTMEGSIQDWQAVGDHVVVFARVSSAERVQGVEPLVFHASTFRGLRSDQQPDSPQSRGR